MNKELSEVLLDFYQKILAPEFVSIQKKQAAHDEKFIDIIGHFDDLYKHLEKLEEEYQMITFYPPSKTLNLKPLKLYKRGLE